MYRTKNIKSYKDRPKRLKKKSRVLLPCNLVLNREYIPKHSQITRKKIQDKYENYPEDSDKMLSSTELSSDSFDECKILDSLENQKCMTSSTKQISSQNFVAVNNNFQYNLAEWAGQCNIPLNHLSKLLKIIVEDGNYKDLPKDARTLLQTPRHTPIKQMDNGAYVHLGIKNYFDTFFEWNPINSNTIWLSLSTDGTPVSLSGSSSLWPIFGALHYNTFSRKVFEIGIFCGSSKPASFNNFLLETVEELCSLIKNGYKNKKLNKTYNVRIKCITADAPALASIKLVKSHGGYSSCTKCEIKGCYSATSHSITYPEINSPLRTNFSFRNRTSFTEGDSHHICQDHTVLEKLPIDMIKDFALDKMHLVDEGVVKKILILLNLKVSRQKLPPKKIAILNKRLEICKEFMPTEFQRKPRSLKYILKMKATEYRDFLLYTGPVILKDVIPRKTYNHFLCLSIAMRILSSPLNYQIYNTYAKSLLQIFVEQFPKIYGAHNVTYNVHGLLHLADDAKRFGPIDGYSCYAFEAHIKKIKKMLHSQNMPLQQCFNRLKENMKFNSEVYNENRSSGIEFSQPQGDSTKNLKANFPFFTIRADKNSDNCVMLNNGTILRVHYLQKDDNTNTKYAVGQKLIEKQPLSGQNCMSLFYLFTGYFKSRSSSHCVNEIKCKMCGLPYYSCGTKYFVCPIIHTLCEITP